MQDWKTSGQLENLFMFSLSGQMWELAKHFSVNTEEPPRGSRESSEREYAGFLFFFSISLKAACLIARVTRACRHTFYFKQFVLC